MKNRQITALTEAGLLSEIGCGVLLIVLGAVTGMMYSDLLIFVLIGFGLSLGFGIIQALITRKAWQGGGAGGRGGVDTSCKYADV